MKTNKQGRWSQVLRDFVLVVIVICSLRWALAEPFLVPSGSMIPTLLIKDYIFVSKFSYGLRVPFTKTWLWGPHLPRRGDVVVFRSKEDNYYFMVKRVVGLPGDVITVGREGQKILVNGEALKQELDPNHKDEDYDVFIENMAGVEHLTQYQKEGSWQAEQEREFVVPSGHIFLMGDNRDRSSDSRVWGPLPVENLLGKAQMIWMSCREEAPAASVFCLGEDLRQDRVFKKIK